MSPVLILSRLCLNRRFQVLGISETSSERTARTFLTVSSSVTRGRPGLPALSRAARQSPAARPRAAPAAPARPGGVPARDHGGHVVVEDLDREVLAPLAED